MTCETTSGGVMTAARKKITTIMTFLAFASHSARIIPIRVRMTEITGISNTVPNIKKTVTRKFRYSPILIESLTLTSFVNEMRNPSIKGTVIKYANATPTQKQIAPNIIASPKIL